MSTEIPYRAICVMREGNRDINIESVDDKRLMSLFDESGRIISNYVDNLCPLRECDVDRLEELKQFYTDCLLSEKISAKFKDYCSLEIDEINAVLEGLAHG